MTFSFVELLALKALNKKYLIETSGIELKISNAQHDLDKSNKRYRLLPLQNELFNDAEICVENIIAVYFTLSLFLLSCCLRSTAVPHLFQKITRRVPWVHGLWAALGETRY